MGIIFCDNSHKVVDSTYSWELLGFKVINYKNKKISFYVYSKIQARAAFLWIASDGRNSLLTVS